jgi:hypothetical protein
MSRGTVGGPQYTAWLTMRAEILAERGLDHTLARRLRGRTREELIANADALVKEQHDSPQPQAGGTA